MISRAPMLLGRRGIWHENARASESGMAAAEIGCLTAWTHGQRSSAGAYICSSAKWCLCDVVRGQVTSGERGAQANFRPFVFQRRSPTGRRVAQQAGWVSRMEKRRWLDWWTFCRLSGALCSSLACDYFVGMSDDLHPASGQGERGEGPECLGVG